MFGIFNNKNNQIMDWKTITYSNLVHTIKS